MTAPTPEKTPDLEPLLDDFVANALDVEEDPQKVMSLRTMWSLEFIPRDENKKPLLDDDGNPWTWKMCTNPREERDDIDSIMEFRRQEYPNDAIRRIRRDVIVTVDEVHE